MHTFPSHLLDGYANFMNGRYTHERERYHELATRGQSPSTMVIACCDSRAAPETIFDAGPGELFVLRNIANIVPPFAPDGGQHGTSAGIEFAVTGLGVQHIVVMGHGRCGGINAALNPGDGTPPEGDFIGKWLSMIAPLTAEIDRGGRMTADERQTAMEWMSVRNSIANLRGFPYVAAREKEGSLALHGAWFDIKLGELWVMSSETGIFERARPGTG